MKKLLTAIFFVTLFSSCGTMMAGETAAPELCRYESIGEIAGLTKDDLYTLVNAWFVETFNSAESVIEYQDKEAGRVMGKYTFSCSDDYYYYEVKQTISVDVQDGRYRFVINDPYIKTVGDIFDSSGQKYSGEYSQLNTVNGLEVAQLKWELLEESFLAYLSTGTLDW